MGRYEQRPFLRFLDCYILDAIGQLNRSQREALEKMEPKLSKVFATAGSWQEIVSVQMDFPKNLPEQIRTIWEGYLRRAKEQGLSVDPNEFVIRFVEENFPHVPSDGVGT